MHIYRQSLSSWPPAATTPSVFVEQRAVCRNQCVGGGRSTRAVSLQAPESGNDVLIVGLRLECGRTRNELATADRRHHRYSHLRATFFSLGLVQVDRGAFPPPGCLAAQ